MPTTWAACCGRPRYLAVRDRYARGEASADELRAAEDTAVREAVALQEGVGLRLATDGEFRRESWNMDFLFELGGIGHDEQPRPTEWHTRSGTLHADFPAVKVNGPIRLEQTIFGDHFAFLQSAVTTAVPKLSIPSPNMLRSLQRNRDEPGIGPYTDIDAFWADVAVAYQAEISALHAQGCRYLQLDDTSFAMFSDPGRREGIKAQGGDPDLTHLDHIATMNAALAGRPPGLVVTTHTCRGNFRSRWSAEGSYDLVAEALFSDPGRRRVLPRVRRRALGRFRAAPLRAEGEGGGARPGDQQRSRSSSRTTSSSAGSTSPRSSSTWTSSPSRRSAASPPGSRGTS